MLAQIITMQAKPSQMETAVELAEHIVAPKVQTYPGFHHWYSLVDWELEKLLSVTIWANKTSIDRYGREFLPQVLHAMSKYIEAETAVVETFEVAIDRVWSA